jgi:hypothetical protein
MSAQGFLGFLYISALLGLVACLPSRFSPKQLIVSGLTFLALGIIGFVLLTNLGEQGFIQTPWAITLGTYASLVSMLLGPVLLGAALSGAMRLRKRR